LPDGVEGLVMWTHWIVALLLYGLFRLWYDNLRGKLTPDEIANFMLQLEGRADTTPEARANLARFLAEDDGRDFVMFNIVKATRELVPDPATGTPVPGVTLLQRYSRHFMPVLFANGGHPLIVRRKVGGYLDAWATEPDPGWTIIGLMRYRSRRDMMKLVVDPRFVEHHPDKLAGTLATFSFPTRPMIALAAGPRLWVGLVLALGAALVQIALG